MSKELVKADILELADEIVSIISERMFNANMEQAEMIYEVGKAVITKPYYKKGTPEARRIISGLAEVIGKSERWVYGAVGFAEKYPSFATALQSEDPDTKGLTVRRIMGIAGSQRDCSHTETIEEVWILTKCRKCGDTLKRERS